MGATSKGWDWRPDARIAKMKDGRTRLVQIPRVRSEALSGLSSRCRVSWILTNNLLQSSDDADVLR